MKPDILLYDDYIHNNGGVYRALGAHYGSHRISFCDAQDIIEGCLTTDIHLFVIPGGADLYYCEKLNGAGNKRIKEYVYEGGNYLGICAGAYYATQEIEWLKGTEDEISGRRELGLINCTATGPIKEYTTNNENMSKAVKIRGLAQNFYGHYWGGPHFKDIPPSCEVLAEYEYLTTNKAAVIKDTYGQGTVVLSSFHLERSPRLLEGKTYKLYNDHYDDDLKTLDQLNATQTAQQIFLNTLLKDFEHDNTERNRA